MTWERQVLEGASDGFGWGNQVVLPVNLAQLRARIDDCTGWYKSARAHSRLCDFTPDGHCCTVFPALLLAFPSQVFARKGLPSLATPRPTERP